MPFRVTAHRLHCLLRLGRMRRGPLSGAAALGALLLALALPAAAVEDALPDPVSSVNVNTADAQTIAYVLKGVGLSRAEAIVEYRERHGEFSQLQQLQNVSGVGERTLELNAERIRFAE